MDNNGKITAPILLAVVDALTGEPGVSHVSLTREPGWASLAAGTSPAAPSAASHAWAALVAQAVIDRALRKNPEDDAETAIAADLKPTLMFRKLDLDQFVEDLTATPARWPVPWPIPGTDRWWPDTCRDDGTLEASDLLVAAVRFDRAADGLDTGDGMRPLLTGVADRLLDAGLARLAEGADYAKHERRPALVSLAKHR